MKVSDRSLQPRVRGRLADHEATQGLQWIFRADTAEAREHFKEPLPASEPMNFGGTFGPPPPDQTFTPIGHISLVSRSGVFIPLQALTRPAAGLVR